VDIAAFIRSLKDTVSSTDTATSQRIIRFNHRQDYELFLVHSSSELLLADRLDAMPIIDGIRCSLPADLDFLQPYAEHLSIEDDNQLLVEGSSQKSLKIDKGIPWGVQQIKAPQAWSTTTGHRVKVGVIDTGVDYSHPDIAQSLSYGINLLNRALPPIDDNGHGTHIAGTIAAANYPQGMIGVAPRALIAPIKAFDHNGSAYVSDIILGIEWCIRNRIQVINMSFGMKTRSKALLTAVTNATSSGSIIIASSGNDGRRRTIDYPARYLQTISVGATSTQRRIAPFSNRGIYIDVYAPGDKVVSAWLNGKYNEMSGTSMATSHVSGAVALLLAYKPGLTPQEIRSLIKRSVQPLGNSKARRLIGELDIMRMLQAADKL